MKRKKSTRYFPETPLELSVFSYTMTEVSYELNLSPDLPAAVQAVALERGEAQEDKDRLKAIDEFRNFIKRKVIFTSVRLLRHGHFIAIFDNFCCRE